MFTQNEGLYIAHGSKGPISIMGKMANRHGLIAGATGTGKTVIVDRNMGNLTTKFGRTF